MTPTLLNAIDRLNEQQKDAVVYKGTPCQIKAYAGTGKTSVLTCRAAKLVAVDEVPLERILMVTFTKKAAGEMRERLLKLLELDPQKAFEADIGTFHHIAARLLRTYAQDVGLDPGYTILDETEAVYAAKACFKEHGLKKGERTKGNPLHSPEQFVELHSKQINQNKDPLEELPQLVDKEDASLCEKLVLAYRDYKKQHNVVDYDDLLEFWRMLMENPRTADELKGRWDHVMVDEYQDTNLLQEEILSGLNTEELCVVGDAQQSIYGWRSAEPKNFREFRQRYPQAVVFPLEINYRTTEHILGAANIILETVGEKNRLKSVRGIAQMPVYLGYANEFEEADGIVREIRRAIERKINPRQICVLIRTGRTSSLVEHKLNEAEIRYEKRGGIKITDRKEIKHCTAMARLLLNPRDVMAWNTALQLYPRIGAAKAKEIFETWLELVERYEDPTERRECAELEELIAKYDKDGDGVSNIIQLATDYQATPEANLVDFIDRIHQTWLAISPINYEKYNLSERQEIIIKEMEYWKKAKNLAELVENMSLSAAEEEQKLQDEMANGIQRIVISTIHSAKGLEWEKVILMGAGSKQMPSQQAQSDAEREEEQRLVYVAVTRARDELLVTYPRVIQGRNGEKEQQQPSPLVKAEFQEQSYQGRQNFTANAPKKQWTKPVPVTPKPEVTVSDDATDPF